MNKSIFLLFILILTSTKILHAQKLRTLFYDDILYGKVKQVSEVEYIPGAITPELKDTTWYDAKGNTLENHRKTSHGTIFKEKYIFGKDGLRKTMTVVGSESDQNLTALFDNQGNMIEYDSYFKNGTLNFKSVYQYDERNNLVKFQLLNGNNNIELNRTYLYNDKDMLIEQDNLTASGKIDYSLTFDYSNFDKKGNWLKRTSQKKSNMGKMLQGLTIDREITYY